MSSVEPAAAAPDESTGEHIYLGDESGVDANAAVDITKKLELRDRLRGTIAKITLYSEGILCLDEIRRGKPLKSHRVNLRYLDPVPVQKTHYAKRTLQITALLAGSAALAGSLTLLDGLGAFALPIAIALAAASLAALWLFIYMSHEKIVFRTMHGRAAALTLTAGFGSMRRFRAAIPELIRAIGDAEEAIGDDTAVFLRAEMREHYRLRGDGILSEEECSDGTGRILMHFDEEM